MSLFFNRACAPAMALVGLVRWLALGARGHTNTYRALFSLAGALRTVQAVHVGLWGALAVSVLQAVPHRSRQDGGRSMKCSTHLRYKGIRQPRVACRQSARNSSCGKSGKAISP